MVDTKPVSDRIAMVDTEGRLTTYGLDILKGFERAIGGPGAVNIPNSMITLPVLNELARFDVEGNLESSGIESVGGNLTIPGTLTVPLIDVPGTFRRFEKVVDQADLASAGEVILLDAGTGEQWDVLEIMISGTGTNFSGGDRLLDIKQGATVYTSAAALLLQTLTSTRWGGTDLPLPSNLNVPTAAGEDIVAAYSGGATDYTAGSCTLILTAAKL